MNNATSGKTLSNFWQTSPRIGPLYCLKICRRWQTGQGGLIERAEFDALTVRPTHDATG